MSDEDIYLEMDENNADEYDVNFDSILEDDSISKTGRGYKKRNLLSARQRIEDYMELRRLRDELDDPDFFI